MAGADKIREALRRWESGEIEKLEFYAATKREPIGLVAAVAEIDEDVIADRRRYLRQLARDNARYAKGNR